MPKKKMIVKPCKMWALVDPQDPQILPHRIYEDRVTEAGRGSVTDGWKTIRVLVTPI